MSNYDTNIPKRVTALFSENYAEQVQPEKMQEFVSETLSSLSEALNYKEDLNLSETDKQFYQRFNAYNIPEADSRKILLASFKIIFDEPELISQLEIFFNEHTELTSKDISGILQGAGPQSWTQIQRCNYLIEISPLLFSLDNSTRPMILNDIFNIGRRLTGVAIKIVNEIPISKRSPAITTAILELLKKSKNDFGFNDNYLSDSDSDTPDNSYTSSDVENTLSNLPREELPGILTFFSKIQPTDTPLKMIELISNTIKERRQRVIVLLQPSLNSAQLVENLLTMPDETLDLCIAYMATNSPHRGANNKTLENFLHLDTAQKLKYANISAVIKTIPAEELTPKIYDGIRHLFKKMRSKEGLVEKISSIIASIPEEERASLFTLFSSITNLSAQEIVSFLEEVAKFSKVQKERLISILDECTQGIGLSLIKDLNQKENLDQFLEEVQSKTANYPTTHKKEIALYLVWNSTKRWIEYLNLSKDYSPSKPWITIPSSGSPSMEVTCTILKHACAFVKKHPVTSEASLRKLFIQLVDLREDDPDDIPEEKLNDILGMTSKFITTTGVKSGYEDLVWIFDKKLSSLHRKVIFGIFPSFLNDKVSVSPMLNALFKNIDNIDKIQSLTLEIQDDEPFDENAHNIVSAIGKLPLESASSLIKQLKPLFARYTKSEDRASILQAFENVDPNDYSRITEAIRPLIDENSPIDYCGKLIMIASLLPPNEQNSQSIKNIDELYKDEKIDDVKDSISFYPREERTFEAIQIKIEHTELFEQHLIDLPIELRNSKNMEMLVSLLNGLTPLNQEFIFVVIPYLTTEQVVSLMRNESQDDLANQVGGFLLTNLEASLTDRNRAHELSELIVECCIVGIFSENSRLFQRAIGTAAITDPDAQDNPNNPYVYHQSLLKVLEDEQPIDVPQTPWNVETLRKKGAKKIYTFADLPANVMNSTLTTLFDELEKHIEDDKDIQNYIEESQGFTFSDLRDNLLSKPLVLGLCNSTGSPEEKIDAAKFHLFSILSAILEKNPTKLAPNSPLTEREEMLLSFSNSVNNCSTGQRGGIADYYNSLNSVFNAADSDRVTSYIDASVQKFLRNMISEEKLLVKLGCRKYSDGEIPEAVHQITYILARYHKQIGVNYQIFFDPHSEIVHDELRSKEPEEVLKIIFEYITIEKMISRLCSDVANKFKQSNLAQERLMKDKKEVAALKSKIAQVNEQTELVRLQKKHGKVKDFQKLVELRDEKLSELKKQLEEAEKLEKEAKESWDAAKGRDINYSVLSEFLKGEGDLMDLILFDEETFEPMGLTEEGARVILTKTGYISESWGPGLKS